MIDRFSHTVDKPQHAPSGGVIILELEDTRHVAWLFTAVDGKE